MITGFVGTAFGIYEFCTDENTGVIEGVRLFCEEKSAKYLAYYKNTLICVCEFNGVSGIAIYDENANLIARKLFERVPSCYISVINGAVFAGNYHTGCVTKLHYPSLEILCSANFAEGAGCHQIIGYKQNLLVPCLNKDKIFVLNEKLETIDELIFPENSGPRHGVIDANKLHVVTELSDTLYTFCETDGIFRPSYQLSLFENRIGATAAIRMRENHTLLISTREINVISAVDVSDKPIIVDTVSCGGKHPRDIMVRGKCVFVCNRDSDSLVSFLYDANGFKQISTAKIAQCVAICMKGEQNEG